MTGISSYIFNAFYDWLRDNDFNPRVVVDAEYPGVVVPKEYVSNGMILISIYHMYVSEFTINETGISFYTRFKGQERYVEIPYPAMIELVCSDNGLSVPVSTWLNNMDHTFSIMSRDNLYDDIDGSLSDAEDYESKSKSNVQFVLEEYDKSDTPKKKSSGKRANAKGSTDDKKAKSSSAKDTADSQKAKPSFTIIN